LLVAGRFKKEIKGKIARDKQLGVLSTIDKTPEHNTQKTIANDLGWSTGKVAMADKIWKEAKPEVKDKIKSGEVSINQAYKEIKKEEKAAAVTGASARYLLLNESPVSAKLHELAEQEPAKTKEKQCLNC
jgi:hypothetical protein